MYNLRDQPKQDKQNVLLYCKQPLPTDRYLCGLDTIWRIVRMANERYNLWDYYSRTLNSPREFNIPNNNYYIFV